MQVNTQEYDRLRLGAGLTDCSAYQIFEITGATATAGLNHITLGDVTRLPIGRLLSTYMLKEDASLLADVLIWNQGARFLVLAETDQSGSLEPWMAKNAAGATVRDLASETYLIGVDGPFAWEVLKELIGVRILGLRYLETMADQKINGVSVDILRAGKTGEYGYILKCAAADGDILRAKILEAGKPFHIAPCSSAAVDLCKLENRFTNVFKEGAASKNVLELNCRLQVSSDKGDYVGRDAIESVLSEGISRRLIGLTIGGGKLPADGTPISHQGTKIGELVSAGYSWSLDSAIGLALMSSDYAYVGCEYEAGEAAAKTVSAPFIYNKSLQIRPQEDSFKTVDWSFKPSQA